MLKRDKKLERVFDFKTPKKEKRCKNGKYMAKKKAYRFKRIDEEKTVGNARK